ncbi:hypothetical protein BAUCODRAFT_124301 [Baudoinia panamericana UAMH 10762]|uniref:ABC transporter n=1 Tax=Baudoinia panamericana (strain UAMH 10762) TaxID=717646 RepID=M2LKB5_BAUPA|nr:uncharacterized protein BAUCODRAFT_124301 [Baudoinia panamericana UAMH 10762]EMC94702.1 hypothetical protein BAUCODRAFT_124301 [Baudoinia panamericana UAMH 10762]
MTTEKDDHASDSPDKTEYGEGNAPSATPWKALFFFTTSANLPVLICGVICSAIAGAANPVQSFLIGRLFEGFTQYASGAWTTITLMQEQKKHVLYLVAVAGGSWIFHSLEFMLWLTFGELQAKSARDRLFHGLLERDIEWYDMRKNGIGALLPRLQTQIRDLQLATSQPLGLLFSAAAQCLLCLGEAFFYQWKLTFVILSTVPVIIVLFGLLARIMQAAITQQQEKLGEAQKCTTSAFTAIETVKCFNGQTLERQKYMTKVREAGNWYLKVARASGLQMATGVFFASAMFVQGFYYGGVLIRNGEATVARVIITFLGAIGAFQALQMILPQVINLEKGRRAGTTLRAVMAEVQRGSNVWQKPGLHSPSTCRGEISITNLSFAYPSRSDHLALDDVSMLIPAGEMTFLIGRSGSGKSTISQLLMGFYRVTSGELAVDGIPVHALDTEWLRSNIALVEQQSFLFSDTVFRNIAFGRKDYSEVSKSEVMAAAEFALLQLMITDMPNGLDTLVGYDGGSISGGQRQRMALARARLRDTPILLLDESTSALDHISRALMMDAIRLWRRGKTTIVITHDISQIQPEDYVYLLEHGKLVQEGYRKHLEKLKDTPFQDLLPEDFRAKAIRAVGSEHSRQPLSMSAVLDLAESGKKPVVDRGINHVQADVANTHNWGLSRILGTIWPNASASGKLMILAGFYGCTVHAIATPVFSYILAKLLGTYAMPHGEGRKQLIYALIILTVSALDAAHTGLQRFLLGQVGQHWVDSFRDRAVKRVLDQPKAFFDDEQNSVSHLVDCLDRNAEAMRELLGTFTALAFIALIMCAISVVWALSAQWKMTLIALSVGPYILGVSRLFAAVSARWETRSNDAAEIASSIFTEVFTNIKTVRALALESHFKDKYIRATNHALVVGFQRSFYTGFFFGLSDSAVSFANALVFYIGTWLVCRGTAVNDVIQVIVMLMFALANISVILECIPQVGSSRDAASRLLRLAHLPQDSHEHLGDTRVESVGEILFNNLRFAYPSRPARTVLNRINLRLHPGVSTAIVGESGSGKSTIATLLLDIWNTAQMPETDAAAAGELIICGRDITTLSTPSLRTAIVPVLQNPTVFAATVAENITYGLPTGSPYCSEVVIIDAAQRAGIHDFINSLPLGYDTPIGDGGMGLSGGQAQRVAIARALVRNPSVLILDEATSALDVESAALVRQAIKSLVDDKSRAMTVIMITHSRDMMEMAKHVVVLDQGNVVEEGGFEELLAKEGALSNLLSGGAWTDNKLSGHTARKRGAPRLKDVRWTSRPVCCIVPTHGYLSIRNVTISQNGFRAPI